MEDSEGSEEAERRVKVKWCLGREGVCVTLPPLRGVDVADVV